MNKKAILPILTFIMVIVVLVRLFVCYAAENNTSAAVSKNNLLHIQHTDDDKEEPELEAETTAVSTSDECKSEKTSFSRESKSNTFFSAQAFGVFSQAGIIASTVLYFIYSLLTSSNLTSFASAVCKFFSKETSSSPAYCKA